MIHDVSMVQTSLTLARGWAANRYPDFVAYLVKRLKVLCPTMGRVRIANVLCRAGLHLGSTTVRRILVPFRDVSFRREVSLFVMWYNAFRQHTALGVRPPDEVYFGKRPAWRSPYFEPRPRWPRRLPCAEPHALIRGRPGARIELAINILSDRKHLPVLELRRAA